MAPVFNLLRIAWAVHNRKKDRFVNLMMSNIFASLVSSLRNSFYESKTSTDQQFLIKEP